MLQVMARVGPQGKTQDLVPCKRPVAMKSQEAEAVFQPFHLLARKLAGTSPKIRRLNAKTTVPNGTWSPEMTAFQRMS